MKRFSAILVLILIALSFFVSCCDEVIIPSDPPASNVVIVGADIAEGEDTTIVASTSPANPEGAVSDVDTTVVIPAGATDTGSATLTVTSYDVENVGDPTIEIEEGKTVVGGLDLKLVVGDTTVSNFEEAVTVTTYVAKGLSNVAVKYNGTGVEPALVSYDSTSGELKFTTTHFSNFYVTSDSVAYILETNTAYELVSEAIENADNNQTIVLMQDNAIAQWAGVSIKDKTIKIDLNAKTLSLTGGLNSGYVIDVGAKAQLNMEDGNIVLDAVFSATNPALNPYAFQVSSNGKLYLENVGLEAKTHDPIIVDGTGAIVSIRKSVINVTVETSNPGEAVRVEDGAKLILESVEMESTSDAVFVDGDYSSVEITDCIINSKGYYILSTNASIDDPHLSINIKSSTLKNTRKEKNEQTGTGILFNISGNLDISDSTIEAGWQALIARGGTVNIENSTIVSTGGVIAEGDYNPMYLLDNYYYAWGQGNQVPYAALVVGNATENSYKYPTTVTLTNSDVIMKRTAGVNDRAARIFIASANGEDCPAVLYLTENDAYKATYEKYAQEIETYHWIWGSKCFINEDMLEYNGTVDHHGDQYKVNPLNDEI